MKPVTDPEVLRQLEAPGSASSGKPVTDPAILAQLEGRQAEPSEDYVQNTQFSADVIGAVTGRGRMQYPEAKEFGDVAPEYGVPLTGIAQSAITSDPASALDILKSHIPELESKKDSRGNLMLRVPGMEWAYLNRPGVSWRDLDEILTQTGATMTMFGKAGTGATIPARIASGIGFGGGAELGREALERGAGSKQEFGALEPSLNAAVPAALAKGVIPALTQQIVSVANKTTWPLRNYYVAIRPTAAAGQAEAMTAAAFQRDMEAETGRVMTGTELRQEARGRLADNPEARLMDIGGRAIAGSRTPIGGQTTYALARTAANQSPTGRGILQAVIEPRFQEQAERGATFLRKLVRDRTVGAEEEALKDIANAHRQYFYRLAYEDGRRGFYPANLDAYQRIPEFNRAIEMARAAIQRRDALGRVVTDPFDLPHPRLNPGGTGRPNLEFWDMVKRALGDIEAEFYKSTQNVRHSEAASIRDLRQQFTADLDAHMSSVAPHPPGTQNSYQNARGVASGLFEAGNALEMGQDFVRSNAPVERVERFLSRLGPMERELFAIGFVDRLIGSINNADDRRNLLRLIAGNETARRKLNVALGPDRARQLETWLLLEKQLDGIRGVMGNSTTVRQLLERALFAGAGAGIANYSDLLDPNNLGALLVGMLFARSQQAIRANINERLFAEVARTLTSRDPEVYVRGIQKLSNPKSLQVLRALDRKLDAYLLGLNRGTIVGETTMHATKKSEDTAP